LAVGETGGELVITGMESIPIVIGGLAIYGISKWVGPLDIHPPTNVPNGDMSIGIPKPYIPPSILNATYPRGPTVYPFPGWDPLVPPPWLSWQGRDGSVTGDKKGSWHNPGTGESLSPNLDHAPPYGPHWDYKDAEEKWHRLFPDETSQQKKGQIIL
jgi:hypothetical protein